MARVWDQAGMLLVLAILFASCALFVDKFFSWVNMKGLMLAVSTVGIVSCTMLFCLAAGHFDLSIGSVVACAGVVAAVVTNHSGSVLIGVLAGLGSGAVVGWINGIVVAKAKINALITTLASMQIVRGLAYIVSDGKAVGVRYENFYRLGNSSFPHIHLPDKIAEHWPRLAAALADGIPTPVWICLACFLVYGLLLQRTTFGRNTLAVGGNAEAARLAGISVDWLVIMIFTLQGIMAAFAGVVLASRMTSGQPMSSMGFELEVISACVLGGVSLTGGVGTMGFVIAGVLIMGIVQNAMNLLNVPTFWQYVARGLILLCAVLFDRFKLRNKGT